MCVCVCVNSVVCVCACAYVHSRACVSASEVPLNVYAQVLVCVSVCARMRSLALTRMRAIEAHPLLNHFDLVQSPPS